MPVTKNCYLSLEIHCYLLLLDRQNKEGGRLSKTTAQQRQDKDQGKPMNNHSPAKARSRLGKV